VVWSFVFLALCRLLQLAVLLCKSEQSKELEILLLRAGDPAPAAAASALSTRGSSDAGCARAGAAARCVDESVGASGDAAALAPSAGQAAPDLPARTPGTAAARSSRPHAGCSARTREPTVGLSPDRRRAAEPRDPRFGDIGADDPRPSRSTAPPQRDEHLWRDFLRQHATTTLACDFFTVETAWLQRIYVLFFISLESRRIEFVTCTSNPTPGSPNRHATLWVPRTPLAVFLDRCAHF
jgi:hypothetical protein